MRRFIWLCAGVAALLVGGAPLSCGGVSSEFSGGLPAAGAAGNGAGGSSGNAGASSGAAGVGVSGSAGSSTGGSGNAGASSGAGGAGVSGSAGAAGNAGTSAGSGGSSAGSGGNAGSAGSGGNAGNAGSAGSGGHPECQQAADCKLTDNCCACQSDPLGTGVPVCNIACIQNACQARGITASDVACVAGRCVLNRSCDERNVTCGSGPPPCAAGSVPVVNAAGTCFTGSCMPAGECSVVGSCAPCDVAGLQCVADMQRGSARYHCVSVPQACSATPTCACMGVCQSPEQCGVPNGTQLTCDCPTC